MNALVVDIGNSRTKWRIVDRSPVAEVDTPRWLCEERALASADWNDMRSAFGRHAAVPVDGAYISNVASTAAVHGVRQSIEAVWPGAMVECVVAGARRCGVVNGYREPAQLGPDRWLAAIGAHALEPDSAVLVCGFGTATTLDFVRPSVGNEALFVGGLIFPGIETMRAALVASTARLSLVDGAVVDFADNTADAIASGIVAAQTGAVMRAIERARNALRAEARSGALVCMLAGGAAAVVAEALGDIDVPLVVAHDLVLRGLATIAVEDRLASPTGTWPIRSH